MVKMSILFIILITFLSACNESPYEKFLECKSKNLDQKNIKKQSEMCFDVHAVSSKWTDNILSGRGGVGIPKFGENVSFTLFNKSKDLLKVNKVKIWKTYTVKNSMDTSDLHLSIVLECSNEIIYPKKKTKIECYNYVSRDEEDNFKSINEAEGKYTIKDSGWQVEDLSKLSTNNKTKFF